MRTMPCPSDLALEQYLLGELAPSQSSVGDHLGACEACRSRVADKAADDIAFANSPGAEAVRRALSARATPAVLTLPGRAPAAVAAGPALLRAMPPARTLPLGARESRRRRISAVLGLAAALLLVALLVLRPRSFTPSSLLTRALPAHVDSSDEEQIVLRVQREWMEATRDKDAAALDRILADDYVYTDSGGGVSYKADTLRQARSGGGKMKAFYTSDEKARVYGDVAIITGRLRVEGVAGGQAYDAEVRFTDILARIDGQWRAVAAHASKSKER